MFKLFVFSSLAIGQMAFAYQPTGQEECIKVANMTASDFAFNNPQPAPAYIGSDGKTVITDKSRIVRQSLENGVETIAYKTKESLYSVNSQNPETEEVEKTLSIERDSSGKLLATTKSSQIANQLKRQKEWAKIGHSMIVVKSTESHFDQSGKDCKLSQIISNELLQDKAEKIVTYDKNFCDTLAPLVKKIGSQNANQCANLIATASLAFESRNKELSKERKSMRNVDYFGENSSFNYSKNFNLSMAIQSCAVADAQMWGFGMNMYSGGMTGSYYPYPTAPSQNAKQKDITKANHETGKE